MMTETDFSKDAIARKWQEKALRLDPDGDIQNYFSRHSLELIRIAGFQPKRFISGIFADADECSKCNKEFDWFDPAQIAYIPQLEGYLGLSMPEDERDLFFLDVAYLAETVICQDCMRVMLRRYLSLVCCARAAKRRERLEKEQSNKFADRIIRDLGEGSEYEK